MPDAPLQTPTKNSDNVGNAGNAGNGGKIGAAFLAAWGASYIMTQMSLHGVDFKVMGVDSEIVKSTIIAHLVTFFVWATPRNLLAWFIGVIRAIKDAIHQIKDATKEE